MMKHAILGWVLLMLAAAPGRADEPTPTAQAAAAELPFMASWSGQSTAELLALEGKVRTDGLVLAFEEALWKKVERVGTSGLSAPERVVLAVTAMGREVNNGGFDQFFINSSHRWAPDLVTSLRTIGCLRSASLAERALAVLGAEEPLTPEGVRRAAQREDPKRDALLSALDNEFYRLREDLDGRLFAHIRASASEVRLR